MSRAIVLCSVGATCIGSAKDFETGGEDLPRGCNDGEGTDCMIEAGLGAAVFTTWVVVKDVAGTGRPADAKPEDSSAAFTEVLADASAEVSEA